MFLVLTCFVLSLFFLVGSSAEECSCSEILLYSPVCGDDNRTYVSRSAVDCYNECHNANVKVIADEPCTCDCPINRMYFPVCGTDEKSYFNPSAVNCHNKCNYPPISIACNGPCNDDDQLLQN